MPEPTQAIIDQFVGAAHGDFATVQALLAEHPSIVNRPASWGELALGAAAQTGQAAIAEHLLAAGAPLDICTAAMLPTEPRGANAVGAHGIPLLYHAIIAGHTDIAEMLLAHGAEINAGAGGSPALHGAVTPAPLAGQVRVFGRADLAKWLLAHGADPNVLNHDGQTPLAAALAQQHDDVAAVLRAHGGTA
jgi:ankyrin repeat protein